MLRNQSCVWLIVLLSFFLSMDAVAETLTVVVSEGPRALVPTALGPGRNRYLEHVYEPLAFIDTRGRPHPVLAERWQQDDRTWTVHLRKDVTFHDGSPGN